MLMMKMTPPAPLYSHVPPDVSGPDYHATPTVGTDSALQEPRETVDEATPPSGSTSPLALLRDPHILPPMQETSTRWVDDPSPGSLQRARTGNLSVPHLESNEAQVGVC
jgi:hypothetical protein